MKQLSPEHEEGTGDPGMGVEATVLLAVGAGVDPVFL